MILGLDMIGWRRYHCLDMVTKTEYEKEAKLIYGEDHRMFNSMDKATKKDWIEFAILRRIHLDIEERSAIKRALKKRKIKYKEDDLTGDLVHLAMKNKINLERVSW